jgi:hypothetical protein
MMSDEVFALAKRFLREGVPSRNRALDRYRETSFSRAAQLARHLQTLTRDLALLDPADVEVDLTGGRLRFRYAIKDGTRTTFVDAYGWALLREERAVEPWRALGDQLSG